ncbi:U6 snRNA-associated Sm-like protein LSm1 [Mycotypha africana]|uniref:U6 snRNA-associated Sm-like protein LSm1 n=1 Tax=Mycotypha africana TaxID=64632 RepID=UPI0022FFCCA7|nr:U6 snRNA-associated Sm-like protein LSm1 [Mycotypha africana]KAI8977464.1 U6 snRNA-associated Sm-like protein LSm1 [Mycotypha africana]
MEITSGPFFTTSTGLIDSIDKKLMVVLRDGRKLIGTLRSFDQFANLVLQDTIERIYVGNCYGDIPRGIFLIRGENVVLLGEIDSDKEEQMNLKMNLRQVPVEDILVAQREELEAKERIDKIKSKVLHNQGFCVDNFQNDLY